MNNCCSKPETNNIISSYKLKKNNKLMTECIICLEPFHKKDNISIINKCGHYYHTKCLCLWFKRKKSCPLCN